MAKDHPNRHDANLGLITTTSAGAFDLVYGPLIAPVILAGAIAWAVYVHWTVPVLPFDDAFITFRYVENLLNGRGLVYNEGQRVFGSSTPLYLLVLAGVRGLFSSVPLPVLAVRFNVVPFAFTGVGVYLLVRRFTGSPLLGALGGAALLLGPWLQAWSAGGMESFLFSALMLFAVLAAAGRRPVWFGLLAGLTCLTRPEGVLLLPIAIIVFFRSKRDLLITAGAFAATVAPWVLFAWVYYGTPVPLSLIAKSKPLYPLPPGHALRRVTARFDAWFTANSLAWLGDLRLLGVMAVVAASTIAALALRTYRRRGAWLPAALFWGFLGLYWAGNPLIFEWYQPPVFVLAGIAVMVGLPAVGHVAARALRREGKSRLAGRAVRAAFAAAMVALVISTFSRYRQARSPVLVLRASPVRRRIEAYRAAAEKLNRIASETDVVAAPEVGSLGFYYKGRMLDSCGLVSPEALDFLPVPPEQRFGPTNGAISVDFVKHTNPDYVVTMPEFSTLSLQRSPWFASQYVLIDTIPLPMRCWRSRVVWIFKRRPVRAR